MAIVFELVTMLAVLALGFVFGRIWEIRRELQRKQSHRRRVPSESTGSMAACQVKPGYPPRTFDGSRLTPDFTQRSAVFDRG